VGPLIPYPEEKLDEWQDAKDGMIDALPAAAQREIRGRKRNVARELSKDYYKMISSTFLL
jgi:hypothetical protein